MPEIATESEIVKTASHPPDCSFLLSHLQVGTTLPQFPKEMCLCSKCHNFEIPVPFKLPAEQAVVYKVHPTAGNTK